MNTSSVTYLLSMLCIAELKVLVLFYSKIKKVKYYSQYCAAVLEWIVYCVIVL